MVYRGGVEVREMDFPSKTFTEWFSFIAFVEGSYVWESKEKRVWSKANYFRSR